VSLNFSGFGAARGAYSERSSPLRAGLAYSSLRLPPPSTGLQLKLSTEENCTVITFLLFGLNAVIISYDWTAQCVVLNAQTFFDCEKRAITRRNEENRYGYIGSTTHKGSVY